MGGGNNPVFWKQSGEEVDLLRGETKALEEPGTASKVLEGGGNRRTAI